MDPNIQAFIQRYQPVFPSQPGELTLLDPHFSIVNYPRHHILLHEQEKHDYAYFMLQGAARSYYLSDGTEVNTWFAFEQDMIGSLHAYRDLPSRETVELLENATLISINLRTLKPLTRSNLLVSQFVGSVIEEYAQFLEDRIFYSQFKNSKERYELLLRHEPQVLQRIPLTYIASYLGISRETLSRLRGK
ncbi:MAG: Crp/Fnr family transcriptional regulator [Cyclobacteriaceae bacterium]|jgi:CRP-like cAMP-binding protein